MAASTRDSSPSPMTNLLRHKQPGTLLWVYSYAECATKVAAGVDRVLARDLADYEDASVKIVIFMQAPQKSEDLNKRERR